MGDPRPRAERFDAMIDFPARHVFKVIGKRRGVFSHACADVLRRLGFDSVEITERASAKGTYVSLTFHLQVDSGTHLDEIYCQLEGLPDLAYIF